MFRPRNAGMAFGLTRGARTGGGFGGPVTTAVAALESDGASCGAEPVRLMGGADLASA